MSTFKWDALGSAITLLDTELNSLATNAGTALGPEIDNNTNGYVEGRLHLHLASMSLTFSAATYLTVFFLPQNGAGDYPSYTTGATPVLAQENYFAATIWLHPAAHSSVVVDEFRDGIRIPPGKYKTVIISTAGGSLAGSGNFLKLYPSPSLVV